MQLSYTTVSEITHKNTPSMANKTPIQWCDSTVNPAMGCDGCELWPTNLMLKNRMVKELAALLPSADRAYLRQIVEKAMGDDSPTILWKRQKAIVWTIVESVWNNSKGTLE